MAEKEDKKTILYLLYTVYVYDVCGTMAETEDKKTTLCLLYTVYRVIFVHWKFLDGWRIRENFQCEIKFGCTCKKFLLTLPVSENFPCRIFPARILVVDEHYLIYSMQQMYMYM